VLRSAIGIYLLIPQHFLRTVGANDDSLISVPDAQDTPRAVATFDAMAHAAVNQKQQPVALKESVLIPAIAIRELHFFGLMTLDQMSYSELPGILGK
jgi:hypothetical protein